MFSGLIEYVGRVESYQGNRLTLSVALKKAKLGDSISVNGICLTVTKLTRKSKQMQLSFDIATETRDRTTISLWKTGDKVNVEPALTLDKALGGHLVQGHIDGVGRLELLKNDGAQRLMVFAAPQAVLSACVNKGSIAIDGVSLTLVNVGEDGFSVAVIPFTWEHTAFQKFKAGQFVNLEADLIGKYVDRFLKKS